MASAGAWSRRCGIGVNEYLVKPVSAQALFDRLVSILAKPRPVVQVGDYYGPEPRNLLHEFRPGWSMNPSLNPRLDRV